MSPLFSADGTRTATNSPRTARGDFAIRPGYWAVVNTGTRATPFITAAERVDAEVSRDKAGFTDYDHAVICSDVTAAGDVYIVEAQPGGAVEVPWHYENRPHQWSNGLTGTGMSVSQGRMAALVARSLASQKIGYSFLDYAALAAHGLGIPVPGLRSFIGATGHMICSQLVDYCCAKGGVQLFDDKRWFGYVKPSDLGWLLRPS